MRQFSSTVQTIIDSGYIRYFFLIKLELSTTYYLCSLPYDVDFEGDTYIGDGGLFEVDEPNFSNILDREAYKVVITDLTDQMKAEFDNNVIGKTITVRLGFLDANNSPILTSDDVVFIYKGFIDKPVIDIDWESKLAVIEGSSPMADLDGTNVLFSSKNGMDQVNTNDTTFDNIYDDGEVTIKWGKK